MRVATLALVLVMAAGGARLAPAQQPPPEAADPIAAIDTLLTSLGGFGEVSPAELQREVGEAGGIPFRAEVALDFISKEQLSRYLAEVFDTEYPLPKAMADQRTLVALGLLDQASDLRRLRARLLEDNVVGFYDERPGRRRLYAVSAHRRLTPANQLILSHELRHAQQDQYMDLHTVLPAAVGDFDDRRLALMSLLEGDATLVMERFLARRLGLSPDGSAGLSGLTMPPDLGLSDTPAVLRDQLILPYVLGREFVLALWKRGGWEAVRKAWTSPPVSTEQVLHPDKYLRGEPALAAAPAWAPAGGRLLNEGVLGEVFVRTLLGPGSEEAAAGWGGDGFRAWEVNGHTLLVWRSLWDTDADRRQFVEALRAAFARRDPRSQRRDGFTVFRQASWQFAIGEQEGAVLLVSADSAPLLHSALAAHARVH